MIDIGETRQVCEEAIVSYGFFAADVFAECANMVSASDFVDPDLRSLFALLVDLTDAVKASDLQAVVLEMRQRGLTLQTALGEPRAFLNALLDKGYAPNNGRYYADQLGKTVRRDTVRSAAGRLSDSLLDPSTDVTEALARFEAVTQHASDRSNSKAVTLQDAMRESLRRQREAKASGTPLGMPTGFASLNKACGGFFKGQLVLLSARSYLGKTALALNLATNLGLRNYKCSFHCLEMKSFELAERVIAAVGGPDLSQFTNGNMIEADFEDAERAIESVKSVPVFLNDSTSETVSTLRGKAKYHRNKYGLDVLFVDHLQRLRKTDPRQETRHHLKDSAKAMKDLAMELDICVVLLSQLRIEADDKEPDDTSYSESKQIFEEADLAMMLHRKKDEPSAKLKLNKVRKAQATELTLNFDGPRQLFTDASKSVPWTGTESNEGYFQ